MVKALEAITKKEFAGYERVRKSGVVNMLDSSVEWRAGIDKETHIGILQHYKALMEKWPDVRAGKE